MYIRVISPMISNLQTHAEQSRAAVYKAGTRTMGRGHWDACGERGELGTRGERRGDVRTWGPGDVKYRGRGR